MYLKYPNNQYSNIFSENLDKKLNILNKLSTISSGAQKYYETIVSTSEYHHESAIYEIEELVDIFKIEQKLKLLSPIIDEDLILSCHINFTTQKIKKYNNKYAFKDYELFALLKEYKNLEIPDKITLSNLQYIFKQIIPSITIKEKNLLLSFLTSPQIKTSRKK